MTIRNKHLISFSSATLITLMVVGVALWGFYELRETTDYLVSVNNKVLETATNFDKELAHSRRAEKEFFIFPNNEKKQTKYVASWTKSYNMIRHYLADLEYLFQAENKQVMLQLIARAKGIMDENEKTFSTVVSKFKRTKSYDTVNKAEYGTFKKQTHILEDIAVRISNYGLAEVQKGRESLARTQRNTLLAIWIISAFAVIWGIIVPIVLSKRLTSTISYLTQVSNDISKGKMEKQIHVTSRDELGDLAHSIQRMQTSIKIMLDKFKKI